VHICRDCSEGPCPTIVSMVLGLKASSPFMRFLKAAFSFKSTGRMSLGDRRGVVLGPAAVGNGRSGVLARDAANDCRVGVTVPDACLFAERGETGTVPVIACIAGAIGSIGEALGPGKNASGPSIISGSSSACRFVGVDTLLVVST